MKNFPFSIKDSSEIYQKQIISMHSATKDLSKRFKALQGLHKSHEHSKNSLAEFFNNYSNPIFDVLYQSIIKYILNIMHFLI